MAALHRSYVTVDDGIVKRAGILESAGFKSFDSLHIACAEKAKVKIMLTTDDNMIRTAERNKELVLTRIINPLIWVAEVFI